MFPLIIFMFLAPFQFQSKILVYGRVDKTIFILAGQSNMAGRGGVVNGTWDGYVPPECRPQPWILRLNAKLMWEEAHEPLHRDIDTRKPCGVGPGMSFANGVLERDPCVGVIGLVPCAIGNTNITEWQRGSYLYNQLLKRANAALQDGGKIRAMLWYQGESDSLDEISARMYKTRLIEFFLDIRGDLASPALPIIQVALGSVAGNYSEVVRKAQLEIKLPNVVCVDAKGLEVKKNDTVHLTTSAQVQLGKMLANAFLQIGI